MLERLECGPTTKSALYKYTYTFTFAFNDNQTSQKCRRCHILLTDESYKFCSVNSGLLGSSPSLRVWQRMKSITIQTFIVTITFTSFTKCSNRRSCLKFWVEAIKDAVIFLCFYRASAHWRAILMWQFSLSVCQFFTTFTFRYSMETACQSYWQKFTATLLWITVDIFCATTKQW